MPPFISGRMSPPLQHTEPHTVSPAVLNFRGGTPPERFLISVTATPCFSQLPRLRLLGSCRPHLLAFQALSSLLQFGTQSSKC